MIRPCNRSAIFVIVYPMPTNAQLWKKRCEIPDMQVLDAAEQYYDASRLLEGQGAGAGLLLPLMNAAIISVELFLKSLSSESIFVPESTFGGYNVYALPQVKKHTLIELYESIPEDIRNELDSRFRASQLALSASSLSEMLGTYEGLFAVSRYPFEEGSDIRRYPVTLLIELASFLRSFAISLRPVDRIDW
jgi:hypothetical protein